jgi:hypothetical protein
MSERAVATTDVERLAKLIRLIFSSDRPGEVMAAIDATKRLLDNNDCDGHWIADRFALGAASVAVVPDDDERGERDDRSAAWFAYHRRRFLSARERLFVENIVARAAPLTPRQAKWLHDIVDRLEAG